MGARTKARKRALDVLFEADQKGDPVLEVLELRLVNPGTEAPLPDYSAQIVRGVVEHQAEIDAALSEHSRDWSLDRMPAVDRALLRIGAWEIAHSAEVPADVAISEAVTLAGDLSTDESASFVNGVLAAVARSNM